MVTAPILVVDHQHPHGCHYVRFGPGGYPQARDGPWCKADVRVESVAMIWRRHTATSMTTEVKDLPRGRVLPADLATMPDDGHRYEIIDGASS